MRKLKFLKLSILTLLLGILFLFSSIWISSNHLVVREYDLKASKITEDLRIVVLADLHDHEFGAENKKLIQKVLEQKPDVVLLVGDLLNSSSANSKVPCDLVRGLSKHVPVYFALGNHEVAYMAEQGEKLIEEVTAAGATVLEKQYVDLEIGGNQIRLGGLYDYAFGIGGDNSVKNAPEWVKVFLSDFQDTDRMKIMMSHRPDSFIFGDAAETWDIDLVVSGHVHGGQVVLPFVGGVWGMDQGWFPEFDHGIAEKGKIQFFITTGLGSSVQKVPRLNNPPEIAVLNIEKS